jgi:predicted permease
MYQLCQFLNVLLEAWPVPAILNAAFPIFGLILAGYLARRFRVRGGESTAALTAFVSIFALPVLFLGTLARTPVAAVLDPSLIAGFGIPVVSTFAVSMLSSRLAVKGGLASMSLQGTAASWGNVLRAAWSVAKNPCRYRSGPAWYGRRSLCPCRRRSRNGSTF